FLHHAGVVTGGGTGEQVVRQSEPGQVLDDDAVVPVDQCAGREPLRVSLYLSGRDVLVGAGAHEHVMSRHPHVPGEDIGRYSEAGDVTDVAWTVGVRPGDGGENVAHGAQA